MNLPLNGRVAIIDDHIEQALPLINVLSSQRVPFVYYSGNAEFLPREDNQHNDIRLLFLDINLIDNSERTNKELKSTLVPVLKSIITPSNYPYIVIYWSRHEEHQKLIEQEIFADDLSDRKPISYISANKSDLINLDGSLTDDFQERVDGLFKDIEQKLSEYPAYSYLMNWENNVHHAVDLTMDSIFQPYHAHEDWGNHANYLIKKLGEAYSGNEIFDGMDPSAKVKSFYSTLSLSLIDTIENQNFNRAIPDIDRFPAEFPEKNVESIYNVNSKLLISLDLIQLDYPGTVLENFSLESEEEYSNLFEVISNGSGKKNKDQIFASWRKICVNVTPLCDAVQNKVAQHRFVKGILVECYQGMEKAFNKNEAIMETNAFSFDGSNYFMVLDFRNFFTVQSFEQIQDHLPIFRLRQQLLAEVQSRLARHINRQGILAVYEKF